MSDEEPVLLPACTACSRLQTCKDVTPQMIVDLDSCVRYEKTNDSAIEARAKFLELFEPWLMVTHLSTEETLRMSKLRPTNVRAALAAICRKLELMSRPKTFGASIDDMVPLIEEAIGDDYDVARMVEDDDLDALVEIISIMDDKDGESEEEEEKPKRGRGGKKPSAGRGSRARGRGAKKEEPPAEEEDEEEEEEEKPKRGRGAKASAGRGRGRGRAAKKEEPAEDSEEEEEEEKPKRGRGRGSAKSTTGRTRGRGRGRGSKKEEPAEEDAEEAVEDASEHDRRVDELIEAVSSLSDAVKTLASDLQKSEKEKAALAEALTFVINELIDAETFDPDRVSEDLEAISTDDVLSGEVAGIIYPE